MFDIGERGEGRELDQTAYEKPFHPGLPNHARDTLFLLLEIRSEGTQVQEGRGQGRPEASLHPNAARGSRRRLNKGLRMLHGGSAATNFTDNHYDHAP